MRNALFVNLLDNHIISFGKILDCTTITVPQYACIYILQLFSEDAICCKTYLKFLRIPSTTAGDGTWTEHSNPQIHLNLNRCPPLGAFRLSTRISPTQPVSTVQLHLEGMLSYRNEMHTICVVFILPTCETSVEQYFETNVMLWGCARWQELCECLIDAVHTQRK